MSEVCAYDSNWPASGLTYGIAGLGGGRRMRRARLARRTPSEGRRQNWPRTRRLCALCHDQQHGKAGLAEDLLGHASQDETLDAAACPRRHGDEVAPPLEGGA